MKNRTVDEMNKLKDQLMSLFKKQGKIKKEIFAPLPTLIQTSANLFKERIAIVDKSKEYTYKQLWEHVEYFTRAFANRIENEDRVAILGDCSFFCIVAILSVWRLGGVIILIAPSFPRDRQDRIIELGRVNKLILLEDSEGSLKRYPFIESIILNDIKPSIDHPILYHNDQAYFFSTSGSTGDPKIILGSHNSLSHFILWQKETFTIRERDRTVLLTSLSSDMVMRDIFTILISGGILHIISRELAGNTIQLFAYMKENKITYINLTPSRINNWLEVLPVSFYGMSFRWVFAAGEPLLKKIVEKWKDKNINGTFVNLYGPTETTLAKCYNIVGEAKDDVIPIGKPIQGTEAYVIRNNKFCKTGEYGEIYIRTPYMSKGYAYPIEENNKKFLFLDSGEIDEKVYATGDIGAFNRKGELNIKGRKDDQIKINGIRFEPHEIERHLEKIKGIKRAVVIPCSFNSKLAIVAFYTSISGVIPKGELVDFLALRIPIAVMPISFIWLKKIPLNGTGKVDRNKLKKSVVKNENGKCEHEYNQKIYNSFQKILNKTISIADNFFLAGGDSLLLIHLIKELDKNLGHTFAISDIIKNPTVLELSKYYDNQKLVRCADQFNPVRFYEKLNNRYVFAFPPISGWGIIYNELAASLLDVSIYAFDFVYSENCIELYSKKIIDIAQEPYVLLGYSAGANLAYEVAKKLISLNKKVHKIVVLDSTLKRMKKEDNIVDDKSLFLNYLHNIGFVDLLLKHNYLAKDSDIDGILQSKIKDYINFLSTIEGKGIVDADILLIKADNNSEIKHEGNVYEWEHATTGTLTVKQGVGNHLNMLNSNNCKANSKLIYSFLKQI